MSLIAPRSNVLIAERSTTIGGLHLGLEKASLERDRLDPTRQDENTIRYQPLSSFSAASGLRIPKFSRCWPGFADIFTIHVTHYSTLELIDNPALRERMDRLGRQRVEAHFSFHRQRQDYMSLYTRLLHAV